MKFQLLIKVKIPTNEECSCFKSLRCCIYHANKCLSANNFMLGLVEHGKGFITSGPGYSLGFPDESFRSGTFFRLRPNPPLATTLKTFGLSKDIEIQHNI